MAAAGASLFRGAKVDWIYSEDRLSHPPSMKLARSSRAAQGQVPATLEVERVWRREAVGHIQTVSSSLKIPVSVAAHAAILLHRFYMEQSFLEFRKFYVATCCLLIAMKLSPEAKVSHMARAKDILRTSLRRTGMDVKDDSPHFQFHLDELLYCERALLATFGFNLDAEVPQALIPKYVNAMGLTKENGFTKGNELITNAVRIANSVGGSTLCLEYPAPTIACAMIQSAVTQMAIELPHSSSGKPWYETVTVTLRDKAGMKDQLGAILLRAKDFMKNEQLHLDSQAPTAASSRRSGGSSSSNTPVRPKRPASERRQSLRKRSRDA